MTEQEIFKTFATKLVEQLQAATPKASGKTAQAIGYTLTGSGIEITAPEHLMALVTGRGPSKGKGGSLYKGILQWVKTKGLLPKEKNMTQESLAFVITRKIHQEGTLLYRKGGNNNSLLSNLVRHTDITPLMDQLAAHYTQQFTQQLTN